MSVNENPTVNLGEIARTLKIDRLPVVGKGLRKAGRAINQWWYGDEGVPAHVDNDVNLRLSSKVFSGGSFLFDPRLTAELRRLAQPGKGFLDAGAHIGVASLIYANAAGKDARIVAFEPNPNAYPLLTENNHVNGLPIECFRMALGNEVGMTTFYVDGKDPNASLSSDAPGKYWYWDGREKPRLTECAVPITTIDKICDAIGFQPGLIKLDVEGAELRVLEGAMETLRNCRPEILMETHVFAWPSFGYGREDLVKLLDDLEYETLDGYGNPFDGLLGDGPEKDNNHFLLKPK